MEINRQFGEFVKTYRAAAIDNRLDHSEIKQLKNHLKTIDEPDLKKRAQQVFASAQLNARKGESLPRLTLFPIEDDMLEADLQLHVSYQSQHFNLVPTGQITIQRQYMEQTLLDALWSSERLRDIEINYDSQTNHYELSGKYQLDYLPDPSFSLTLEPTSDKGKLNFLIHELDYSGPELDFISEWLLKKLATSLSEIGVNSHFNARNQSMQLDALSLDLNDLVQFSSGLDSKVEVDFEEVNLNIDMDQRGNIVLDLFRDQIIDINRSNDSDLDLILKPEALKNMLNSALRSSDLSIKNIIIKEDQTLSFACEAHVKQMSEGLATIMMLLSRGRGARGGQSKVELDIEGHLEGKRLWLTPQINKQILALANHKMNDNVMVKLDENSSRYYVDLGRLLSPDVGQVESIQILNQEVILKSSLNANKLIQN